MLRDIYRSSDSIVEINSNHYRIVEAWSSYRYKSKKDHKRNEKVYDFLIIIQNVDNNEFGLELNTTSEYSKFIQIKPIDSKNWFGIESNKLAATISLIEVPEPPDEIKVRFISDQTKKVVTFKKNSTSTNRR